MLCYSYIYDNFYDMVFKLKHKSYIASGSVHSPPPAMKNFSRTPISATETLKIISLLALTQAFLSYIFGINEDM